MTTLQVLQIILRMATMLAARHVDPGSSTTSEATRVKLAGRVRDLLKSEGIPLDD